ncbi:MAG: hypothetical protein K940chlam2_01355 [Chlamydiae bacterium]|nr:hypothetical protein [Chlamydiota bacterium]
MTDGAKILWAFAMLPAIATTAFLNADDDSNVRNLENRVTALESRKDSCCMVNPSARPFAKDCWGFYVSVDPLLWQGHMNGTGYGIRTANGPSFFNDIGAAQVINPDFDWDWGFRLALGLNLAHDGWDSMLQWTRWTSSSSRSRTPEDNTRIFPTMGHPARTFGANVAIGAARNNLDICLNMLDWETGREFYVSQYLTIRPHGGLRTAWLQFDDFDVSYSGLDNNPLTPDTKREIEMEQRYWGLGIRMGLDLQWGFGCGFSAFTNWATAVLHSYMKVDHQEKTVDANGNKEQYQRTKDFYHFGSQINDMQIGLRWDWLSCDECYHFGIEAGWENHLFPSQNQFLRWADDGMDGKFFSNQGDFATQGWFAKVRFDF